LAAFKKARTDIEHLKLLLVPRHPDRFDQVFKLCQQQGFHTLRRSNVKTATTSLPDFDILLGDTMGEMMILYGCAHIAFVGGSLVANGGHNAIEPAVWQLPIITGPSQFNFAEVARQLSEAGGQVFVNDASELAKTVCDLINTQEGARAGASALAVAHPTQGALARLMALINAHLTNTKNTRS